MIPIRLGISGHHQTPAVGGGQVDIHPLDRGELLEHLARGQPWRMALGQVLEVT